MPEQIVQNATKTNSKQLNNIKCGEILLNLQNWQLQFICADCNATADNLETFLQHNLLHFVNNYKWSLDVVVDVQEKISDIISKQIIEVKTELPELDANAVVDCCLFLEAKPAAAQEVELKALTNNDAALAHNMVTDMTGDDDVDKFENAEIGATSAQQQTPAAAPHDEPLIEHLTDDEVESTNNPIDALPAPLCQQHRCDVCGKTFRQANTLRLHKRKVHFGWKPSLCSICGKSTNIKTHDIKCAEIAAAQTCQICNKTFRTLTRFKTHQRIHLNIKPFACDVCDMRFVEAGNLNIHKKRKHLQEKPHLCPDCGKSFCTSTELKIHQRSHTQAKPYACQLCSRAYSNGSALVVHMRIHNNERPYKCTLCERSFPASEHLKRHLLVHSGVRNFNCSLCDGKFTRATHLRNHMKLHSGLKEFQCDICAREFAQKCNLNVHRKKCRAKNHNSQLD